VSRTLENAKAADVRLSRAETEELIGVMEAVGVRGTRYIGAQMDHVWG
jgi:hypothetical protein